MSLFKKMQKQEIVILEKGFVKNTIMSSMLGAAAALSTPANAGDRDIASVQKPRAEAPASQFNKDQILDAIKTVESSGGKDTNHKVVNSGLNAGTRSSSAYGVMPITAKDIISKNKNLKAKYGHLLDMKGDEFHQEYHKDPDLDRTIASHYYDKSAKLFGNDPHKIGYSWLNGRSGAMKAVKSGKDIKNHWHVKKIIDALKSSK